MLYTIQQEEGRELTGRLQTDWGLGLDQPVLVYSKFWYSRIC